MGLLSHDQILKLHRAALTAGLVGGRPALLAGVDAGLVAGLPVAAAPAAQILTDLTELNGAGALEDGSVPLKTWLQNAVALAGPRMEARVFRRALEHLGDAGQAPKPHGAPPAEPAGASGNVSQLSVNISNSIVGDGACSEGHVTQGAGTAPIRPGAFVGRFEHLNALRNIDRDGTHNVYLRGLHGIGKTSLVRRFLEEARCDGRDVHYINFQHPAIDDGTLPDAFLPLARSDVALADRIWAGLGKLRTLDQSTVVVFDEFEALLYHMSEDAAVNILDRWHHCSRAFGWPLTILIVQRDWEVLGVQRAHGSPPPPLVSLEGVREEYSYDSPPPPIKIEVGPLGTREQYDLISGFSSILPSIVQWAQPLGILSGGIPYLLLTWLRLVLEWEDGEYDFDSWCEFLVERESAYLGSLWAGLTHYERGAVVATMLRRFSSSLPPPWDTAPQQSFSWGESLGGASAALCWWLRTSGDALAAEGMNSRLVRSVFDELRKRVRSVRTLGALVKMWTRP